MASQDLIPPLPWWKRPSPIWLLSLMPASSIALSAALAPRVEIYIQLACQVHKPDIFYDQGVFASAASKCAADPVVQVAVAKLSAVIAACMGVLGCLTTGYWGAFSDRHGRTRILGICIVGLLVTDVNFILVYYRSRYLPGGYWFLVVGSIIEGCLGGTTTAVAATHAYMADTTSTAARSRVFSMSLGLLFTGMAIGPTLGGLLIRFTHQTISVFYLASTLHFIYAFLIWLIIPESLTTAQMSESQKRYTDLIEHDRRRGATMKRAFSFLSPLSILSPNFVNAQKTGAKARRKDWNLLLVGVAYGFTITIMGSYNFKFQYAAYAFGWSAETIGYWLSLIGATRAFFLAVLLPLAIKLYKIKYPPPPAVNTDLGSEREPLLSENDYPGDSAGSSLPPPDHHSALFDIGLARTSLIIEIVAYTFMGLAVHPLEFTLFGMLGSFGTGFSPGIQSVALELYTRKGGNESGRLFGALSVIQALSSQILGPAMYGFVYAKTVTTYPRTIFFVTVGTLVISLFLLGFVRVGAPKDRIVRLDGADAEEGSTSH